MKIAFVSNAKSIHIVRWANAFARRGNDVTVISCSDDAKCDRSLYHSGVKIVALRFSVPWGYYLNAGQLRRLVKREKFDVVNIHYASGYGTLGRRAKLKDALLSIWGSDVYEFPYQSKLKMKILRKNLSYFRFAASTSHCMARQAKKIADREYFITPFGVDTDLFRPMPECKPKNKIVLGTVKTLLPKYGIGDTIEAFIKLLARLKGEKKDGLADKLYYEIYGRGELRDALQARINEAGLQGRITLCGYVANDRLPEIYNRFIFSNSNSISDSESFGVAAVEAMACGIPVQVSDADGFAEVTEDGVTGLIAPKGDVDAIAENMYKLLTDAALRERMGKAARERVLKLYDWKANVDTMQDIYRHISGEL